MTDAHSGGAPWQLLETTVAPRGRGARRQLFDGVRHPDNEPGLEVEGHGVVKG